MVPTISDGWESVEDDPWVGRPFTSQTPENIVAPLSTLKTACRVMIRMLAEKLRIDKETVCKIITKNLGKKKLYMRFIPHALTVEQWEDFVTSCQDLEMLNNNPEFLNKMWRMMNSGAVSIIQKVNGKVQLG